eukprot:scaffold43811_cov62-Phaeocystis_antarctica.AAC.7
MRERGAERSARLWDMKPADAMIFWRLQCRRQVNAHQLIRGRRWAVHPVPLGTPLTLTRLDSLPIGKPSACAASCTAAKHSLSAALRWPSGQPVNCPNEGLSATRESSAQPVASEDSTPGGVDTLRPARAAGAWGASTPSPMCDVLSICTHKLTLFGSDPMTRHERTRPVSRSSARRRRSAPQGVGPSRCSFRCLGVIGRHSERRSQALAGERKRAITAGERQFSVVG